MTMNLRLVHRSLALGAAVMLAACGDAGSDASFDDGTGGSSGPGSGDDGNGVGDTGGAVDETGDAPPPEMEDEGDFRVPRASGRFVYSASETTDSVAVIDSVTLAIDVV